jgi:hypothetical protein
MSTLPEAPAKCAVCRSFERMNTLFSEVPEELRDMAALADIEQLRTAHAAKCRFLNPDAEATVMEGNAPGVTSTECGECSRLDALASRAHHDPDPDVFRQTIQDRRDRHARKCPNPRVGVSSE